MKKHLLFAVSAIGLAACTQADQGPTLTAITSAFGRDFTLGYQQQATLTADQPELTITVTDLQYTFCPDNLRCLVGTTAAPVLSVKDAQGQTQQVVLAKGKLPYNVNPGSWIDTASVRANGQRYLLYHVKWALDANRAQQNAVEKKDFTVTLRVTKPN